MRRSIQLTYSKTMSSKNLETSLRRGESPLFTSTAKETNRNLHAQAIDEDEEDALFEAGEFGDPNRVALQGTALRFASKRISVIRHCLLPLQFFSTGANVRSINGCTFQKFHDYVKIVQNERKRRIVIENDEDD